jgi:hypothetical protein
MTAADVLEVLGILEEAGVGVWLDGGWAIDASRRTDGNHDDLARGRSEDGKERSC